METSQAVLTSLYYAGLNRTQYHPGPDRITWYLERYHGFKTTCSSVSRTIKRNGIGPLPGNVGRRAIHPHRYAKQVPGHHIQIDVQFLSSVNDTGHKVRRYQYTAIDDATRIRALKIYRKHNQKSSVDFIDYVVKKFPFRIHTVRTDQEEFYQLLTFKDDVDLNMKLAVREEFYNFNRPHGAHSGLPPYEALINMLG